LLHQRELRERHQRVQGGDTSDFDIQGFLDELENIPSENDSEA